MKLDSSVLVVKGTCFAVIGFFTPLTVGLAQWANSGQWPDRIIWVVMAASCMVGMASQVLSFLSGSYSDYVQSRTNGHAPTPPPISSLPANPPVATLPPENKP